MQHRSSDVKQWVDGRIFLMLPIGFAFWIFWCVGFFLLPNTLLNIWKNDGVFGFIFILFAGVAVGGWLFAFGVLRYILCPNKFFIAWHVCFSGQFFEVRGFYRKKMRFLANEVSSVEPYLLPRKQFGWHMGSLLSQPKSNTDMINWKIELKNGRHFYLAAEMGDVTELKDLLLLLAKQNSQVTEVSG